MTMRVTTTSTTTTASPTSKEIAQTTSTTSAVVVATSKRETKSNHRNHGEHQSPNNDCKDDDDDDDDGGAVVVKVDEDVVGVVKEDDWGLSLDFHLFAQHQQYKVYSYNSFFDCSRCDKQDQDQGNCNDDNDNDNDNDTETLTTTASQQSSITPASISAEAVTVAAHPFQQSSSYFWIECVKDLTPLDMMQLSSGVHDATCNCVWTGAYLFLAALSLSQWVLSTTRTTTTSKPSSPSGRFVSLFSQCIENQTILELGSGTGLAGLGCLLFTSSLAPVTTSTSTKTRTTDEAVTTTTATPNGQTRVCFTDADPAALRLCHRNCQLNQISQNTYQICSHTWGTALHLNNQQLEEEEEHDKEQREAIPDTKHTNIEISTTYQDDSFASFDTVIATDILYDIAMLGPIFQSARQALLYGHNADTTNTTTTSASSATFAVEEDDGKTGHDADDNKTNYQSGRFILSHVPRACYTSQNPPPPSSSKQPCNQTNNGEDQKNNRRNALDERIIQEAVQDHGFELECQIYPLELLEDVTMMMATSTSKVAAAAATTTWASRTCFPTDALNQTSLEEMEELGASLFIFRLRTNTTTTASTGAPSVS